MSESCFAMPVLPGKTDLARRYWEEIRGPRAQEVAEHLRRTGITRLLAYLQRTPSGDLLVQHIVATDSLDTALDRAASSGLEISRWTERQFKEFSGIDWSDPANRPDLQVLLDWRAGAAPSGAETVFAMPVLPGKRDQAERYWATLRGPQAAEGEARLRRMGINRLHACLQSGEGGDLIVQYLVTAGTIDEMLREAETADSDYDRWTMAQFQEFSGIDWYNFVGSAPALERLFDWTAP